MAEKRLIGRTIQKHDLEANWLKATNFIPLQGEIIVYDKDSTHNYERIKVGDGVTVVSSLPFVDDTKVDKVSGKGLSTNDYTTAEKDKLAGIATGANKTVVDSSLSSTSTNPVQNKVVNTAISNLNTLVGDKAVSEQITDAVSAITPDNIGAVDVDDYYGPVKKTGSMISVDTIEGLAIHPISYIEPTQSGSGDPSPDNIRAISGWDAVGVNRTGKNLAIIEDKSVTSASIAVTVEAGIVTMNGTSTTSSATILLWKSVLKPGKYTLSHNVFAGEMVGAPANASVLNVGSSRTRLNAPALTFTVNEEAEYSFSIVRASSAVTYDNFTFSVQLECGETATEFEVPNTQALTAELPEMVYGGVLDWNTGLLTVDTAFFTIDGTENWQAYNSETRPHLFYLNDNNFEAKSGNIAVSICSHFPYTPSSSLGNVNAQRFQINSDTSIPSSRFYISSVTHTDVNSFKAYLVEQYAAGSPIQVSYKLFEPYTIQLTPQQLSTINGTNNVWSNCGDTNAIFNLTPTTPNFDKADKTQGVYYIEGTGTTAGTWLGEHSDIKEYYNGLMVAYKLNVAGASSTTLNINNLGAVKVVRNVTTAISTSYAVNSIIFLTYTTDSSGTSYWRVADYDTNNKTATSNKVDTKLFLIGGASQSSSGVTTYSNVGVYVGTDNCLYSNGVKVATTDEVTVISGLVGDTAVSEQINTAVATKADLANGQYAVTASSSDGVAYTATVPSITELVTGASFIMIPGKTSTSTTPSINVNGLGDRPIRRKLSNIYASVQNGYAVGWLYSGVPFRLIYDGRAKVGTVTGCWIVEGCNKPSASDLSGSVTDAKNATNDGEGQEIAATYIKGLTVGADTITYTLGDGTTGTTSLSALIQALLPKVTNITLRAASWNGSSAPYYQDVSSSYVTQTSKVDIQPTAEQLAEWQNEGLAFNTLSFDGAFRVYVSDVKPTVDYTVQATIQEVVEV